MSNPPISRRRSGPALARLIVAIVALLVAGGCGSSEGADGSPGQPTGDGPRVAADRFDGSFEIVEVVAGGAGVTLEQRPSIEIGAEFGELTVLPGCNTYFGSFSLDEDGGASFTVPGGSQLDCGDLTGQEQAILAALAAVDQWLATDDGFRFDGSGSTLSIVGPAG